MHSVGLVEYGALRPAPAEASGLSHIDPDRPVYIIPVGEVAILERKAQIPLRHTMFSKPTALLSFVAAATLASASTCTNTKGLRADQWELKVSSATNCRYIEGEPAFYAGALEKGCYGCYELSSHVRGKLRSFAFTAGNSYDLRLYKDSRCKELISAQCSSCLTSRR
ncbi:hypothetical protein BV22DRAFT_19458 [Leucogyrophana mollusca]|uniref:Uncharacterized protein n=1 Tax=Leucogyrophana mollusca TaxID=85980 RepID=A0ACB8BYC7_9AGAM|nr:hypothetical protein BV22DRAFT_19458 [Leucogyrophana mollusca]